MDQEQSSEQEGHSGLFHRIGSTKVWIILRRRWMLSSIITLVLLCCIGILPLPFGEVLDLRTKNPEITAFMAQHEAAAKERGKRFHKFQIWIPLERIPKSLVDAVVVAEDGTFWSHSGFDWFEFRESLERNIEAGRAARGASTISQQLVKNIFLSSSKNPFRKLREWILTWYLERTLSKGRILELYLNLIEWGDGVYGVEAASRFYFDKSAADLSPEESRRLAAIIPSPKRHRADEDSPFVIRRAALILQRMRVRGMVLPEAGEPVDSTTFPVDSLLLVPDSLETPEDHP